MDKNKIKKYAVWARNELIEKVTQKAQQFGVEDGKYTDPNSDSVNGTILTDTQKKQRQALIRKVEQDGFGQVMEEVAYTWFNRFIALRFMEVNGYLPSHVRVFTDENNNFKPQILSEALHLELNGLDQDKVYAMKEANQDEDLFKYLLIVQCNDLNSILPGMFQKIADYTELLLPDYLLREGSVIEQMIAMIPEEDWTDQVQIIGWLYQYYNTEPKDAVFAGLKKNQKITKEKIPAATQLFTPDWIVRYMVENSLGRLWLEGHPDNKDQFLPTKEEQDQYIQTHEDDGKWHYYLEEARQEPEVQKQLDEIHREYSALKPEDILCIDPCQGSGHILCYLFDTLVKIYEDYGYSAREAASLIVEHNLWGLDIDERASQLAYFSVMMKARQYDRRFLTRGIQPHVYAIEESNHINKNAVDYFVNGDPKLRDAMDTLISELHDAKEYGSILTVSTLDFDSLNQRLKECDDEISMFHDMVQNDIAPLIHVGQALAQKYHVVVTNPPYMGGNGMDNNLSKYVKDNYPNEKYDLFSCFISKGFNLAKTIGLISMITMESWMFLSSFEKMRQVIIKNKIIRNMVHMPYLGKGGTSLGINFGTTVVVFNNFHVKKYNGQYVYIRYFETDEDGVPLEFPIINERFKSTSLEAISKIPNSPIAYWASKELLNAFAVGEKLKKAGDTRQGMATSDNNRFLRLWFEVSFSKIGFGMNADGAKKSRYKWFPYNKGGAYRKWYGNQEYVINYENDGAEVKDYAASLYKSASRTIKSMSEYFKPCLSWSKVTTVDIAFRYYPKGFIFDVAGCCIFYDDRTEMLYQFGFLNSAVCETILNMISPTMNYEAGHIASLPIIKDDAMMQDVIKIVKENIDLEQQDWDSFETSWEFNRNSLIRNTKTVREAFEKWRNECQVQLNQLKANEEELNRIFIDIYGLQDELSPEEDDKDVTVRKADLGRDIRSFISYAVGCMFGRYSLDADGLAYAGGYWDASKYMTFIPDKDNIIPICDDEYFDDDIVGRFVKFVEVVYGADTLEENLKFIADALGGKGTPREVIRKYFLNDFYKDHCKTYQKRPIYWLFDSGKKNGFKCLIYMHRYQPDTIARIRTDYVHEQQSRYRTAIEETEQRLESASGSNRVQLNKRLKKLRDQDEELHTYEEKIHHLADQMISIDLDDGVKHNYAIFQDVLAKIK